MIARFSLMLIWIAVGGLALAFTVFANYYFPWSWVVLLPFAYLMGPVTRLPGWSHGTARLGEANDLARVGSLDGVGAILGKIQSPSFVPATRNLFNAPA